MNTAAVWMFMACFDAACIGPETRVITGLTEQQCLFLVKRTINAVADKTWPSAECIGPDGKDWLQSKARTRNMP